MIKKKVILILTLLLPVLHGYAEDRTTTYQTISDISYVSSDEPDAYRLERCKLDIYYPTNAEKPFKTVIWFHGGGLMTGEKHFPDMLKKRGVAIVAVNYRLFPKAKNPQYTEDAAAAVAWVLSHISEYGGDPKEVNVSGHSAGGYLTLMLALDKSYLGAYGVDADSIRAYYPIGGQTATHYTIRKERNISFTTPIADRYAPLNNIRKLGTQLTLITGDRNLEQMCRYEENLYLKTALEGIGNAPVPLYEMGGFNHSESYVPATLLIYKLIRDQR